MNEYRVLKFTNGKSSKYSIHLVHFNDNGMPFKYDKLPALLEAVTPQDLTNLTIHVQSALTKTVIDAKIFEMEPLTDNDKKILNKLLNGK